MAAKCEHRTLSCATTGVMRDCDAHFNKELNVLRQSVASVQPRRMLTSPKSARVVLNCRILLLFSCFEIIKSETEAVRKERRSSAFTCWWWWWGGGGGLQPFVPLPGGGMGLRGGFPPNGPRGGRIRFFFKIVFLKFIY